VHRWETTAAPVQVALHFGFKFSKACPILRHRQWFWSYGQDLTVLWKRSTGSRCFGSGNVLTAPTSSNWLPYLLEISLSLYQIDKRRIGEFEVRRPLRSRIRDTHVRERSLKSSVCLICTEIRTCSKSEKRARGVDFQISHLESTLHPGGSRRCVCVSFERPVWVLRFRGLRVNVLDFPKPKTRQFPPALVLVDRSGRRRDFLIIHMPYHRLATPVLPPIGTARVSVPVQNLPNWAMTVSPNQSKPTECVEIQLYGSVGWQSVLLLTWRLPAPRVTAFRNPAAGLMRHR